jgi:hypothetical protein
VGDLEAPQSLWVTLEAFVVDLEAFVGDLEAYVGDPRWILDSATLGRLHFGRLLGLTRFR